MDAFQDLLIDLDVPCNIYFQRADQLGLHSLYVPPPSVWTPTQIHANSASPRRLLAWNRRSMRASQRKFRNSSQNLEGFKLSGQRRPKAGRSGFTREPANGSAMQSMAVDNSLTCMLLGSSIIWELSDGVYPIYVKVSRLFCMEKNCSQSPIALKACHYLSTGSQLPYNNILIHLSS